MQTGLPDPAALDEAFTLLWPLPLALSLSDLLYQGPISPTIPAKHREVVGGGDCRRSGSVPDLLWNPGIAPTSLWASVIEGLELIKELQGLSALTS